MSGFQVEQPILCSPFEEPTEHWHIVKGEEPRRLPSRRSAVYFYRPPGPDEDDAGTGAQGAAIEIKLVNLIRERLRE